MPILLEVPQRRRLEAATMGNLRRGWNAVSSGSFRHQPGIGATRRDRTGDPLITNEMLYQLS